MNDAVLALLTVLAAPLLGGLVRGLDRRLTARIQGRRGPPLLQPFYDILKLFRKATLVVNRAQILYAYLHLAFMALALVMLVTGQDAVMFLFVLAFSTFALILGGMCVRSPYSRIGSQREILLLAAYEPVLILMMVGFYLVNRDFELQSVLDARRPFLFAMPLMFLAFLLVVAIKLQKSPFDVATSHHAHQELVKGLTIEFSGPALGVLEIAHCYEVVLVLGLAALFGAGSVWLTALLPALALAAAILLDNLAARLTTLWIFRFMWTFALACAATNLIWLYWL